MLHLAITPVSVPEYYAETFQPDVVRDSDARFRDHRGAKCAHELEGNDAPNSLEIMRVANETHLGFESFYVDTLGADGTAGLHTIRGARIGIHHAGSHKLGSVDDWVYELDASGIDGLTMVCSQPYTPEAPTPVVAEARIYVSVRGWHEWGDQLRVWAEVGDEGYAWQVSLLPGCTPVATRESIDVLRLRAPRDGVAYEGAPGGAGDPSNGAEDWVWTTLSAALGVVDEGTGAARVCVGLQSGAGTEMVLVDSLALNLSAAGPAAPTPCSPTRLVSPSDLEPHAVAGSCADDDALTASEAGGFVVVALLLMALEALCLCAAFKHVRVHGVGGRRASPSVSTLRVERTAEMPSMVEVASMEETTSMEVRGHRGRQCMTGTAVSATADVVAARGASAGAAASACAAATASDAAAESPAPPGPVAAPVGDSEITEARA